MDESRVSAGVSRRKAIKLGVETSLVASAMLGWCGVAKAQTSADIDVLNFALNLSYLQSQFFSYAATGAAVAPLTGTGTPGTVTPGSLVPLDAATRALIVEIAADTRNVATPMRVIVGAPAIGQPALDITGGTTGPFAGIMQQAGVIAPGASFDPYASETNFLYSALYLKDVTVAAYRGLLPLLSNRVVVQLLGGLLATECHHAAVIRSLLYTRGATTPLIRTNADRIATFRRALAGVPTDVGVSPTTRTYAGPTGSTTVTVAAVTPNDANGEVAGRTAGQTLNLLYISRTAVTQGGFFPAGVNGTFRTSAGV